MEIRALVVDDSTVMRRAIMYALQRLEGLICVEAQDGADALRKFAQGRFDIVLTDINMPLMDGLKLISHLRKDPANKALPIVVITTEAAESDKQRALALGASLYLVKPVQASTVLSTVKQLLGRE
jgi:two-component system chemotaxis response regulator CheY